ncbi:hypothetical protein BCR43DRAFT_484622 [Syncephalastrum racemosum]|uniref:Alkyl hydroperoxide reductase subunit C/ Thiol specific antioxidant domain-containing protein n=1 Tax=Syncephalastrum racemosum TaxID=13706 RepID=A0A1X2HKT0_SYNRA|nr:hypothetical protein BCR43DRAFT_484622 [Syncephalastrum racemosum]
MSATLHGKPAPDFRLPAIVSGSITELSSSDFDGKNIVLLFYARRCYHDEPFAPSVITWSQRVADFHARNTQLLAVSTEWGIVGNQVILLTFFIAAFYV